MILIFILFGLINSSCKSELNDNLTVNQNGGNNIEILDSNQNNLDTDFINTHLKIENIHQSKESEISIPAEPSAPSSEREVSLNVNIEKVKIESISEEDLESNVLGIPVEETGSEAILVEPFQENSKEESLNEALSHEKFNALLLKHVDAAGNVNYKAFKKDETELNIYLNLLAENSPSNNWSKEAKLAYWINTYNAYTIKLILKNYPTNSILDISNGKPWDQKWIKVGTNTFSLNQIENEIIRPQFKEPRIHFALNCAAKSCPPLANKAFSESNLIQLLEDRTKAFVQNEKFNQINKSNITVSKIFEWYAEDFGNLVEFLNKYSKVTINSNPKILFLDYDWRLNQK